MAKEEVNVAHLVVYEDLSKSYGFIQHSDGSVLSSMRIWPINIPFEKRNKPEGTYEEILGKSAAKEIIKKEGLELIVVHPVHKTEKIKSPEYQGLKEVAESIASSCSYRIGVRVDETPLDLPSK